MISMFCLLFIIVTTVFGFIFHNFGVPGKIKNNQVDLIYIRICWKRFLLPGWMFHWEWKKIRRLISLLDGCWKCKCWKVSDSLIAVVPILAVLNLRLLLTFFELRYAYAVASALHGVQHILRKDFMLQVSI